MKTAIETLSEVLISDINTIDLSAHMRVSDALKSMKIYANQKFDEAADSADWTFDGLNCLDNVIIDKHSILSLKDEL